LTGFLAIGLVSAVVSVPILYLFYFYDANEWEDQPILVVSIIMGVSAVLGISAQIIQDVLIDSDPIRSMSQGRFDSSELLVGIVAAASTILLAQVGPVILARLPKFDDLIDGLTFGVAAGSAFAAGESLTTSWKFVATTGLRTPSNDTLLWLVKVLELGLLRPIIIGAAVGLVVAAFAGIGDGPGRLNSNYVRTNLTSFGLLVVWQFGYLVIDRVADGGARSLIGLAWASIVAALLILRLRFVLHVALIEAASEAAARGSALQSANKGIGFCPECSMPLMDGANFCSSCGTSVRAHSKLSRRDIVTFVSAS
jgi:RsiW-degrading membrane proteinase PrsW (M82 family)